MFNFISDIGLQDSVFFLYALTLFDFKCIIFHRKDNEILIYYVSDF